MAEGTKDVTNDLQKRTDPSDTDQLIMVNATTKEVEYLETGQLAERLDIHPASSDEVFGL